MKQGGKWIVSQSNRENSQLVGQGSWGPGTTWWAITGLPEFSFGANNQQKKTTEEHGRLVAIVLPVIAHIFFLPSFEIWLYD